MYTWREIFGAFGLSDHGCPPESSMFQIYTREGGSWRRAGSKAGRGVSWMKERPSRRSMGGGWLGVI